MLVMKAVGLYAHLQEAKCILQPTTLFMPNIENHQEYENVRLSRYVLC